MLKKPSILLSSYSSIHLTGNAQSNSPTIHSHLHPHPPPSLQPTSRRTKPPLHRRTFADVRPSTPPSDHAWPPGPPSHLPTPYEIFRLPNGAPYNKQRFYELVKLYHPDKHHGDAEPPLPPATKLERYRLVVAAHALLSSPTARRAYDRHGLGWGPSPSVRPPTHPSSSSHPPNPWSNFADPTTSPFRNATWEDWERWHHHNRRRQPHASPHRTSSKQRPHFFSNGGFVAVLALCATLAGMGEISRARQLGGSVLEQLEDVHVRSWRDLEARRRESAVAGRAERVRRFVEGREARWVGGRGEEREERWGGGEGGFLGEPEGRAGGEAGV